MLFFLWLAITLVTPSLACAADATARPNIVFVLADDLGWSDLACYGSQFHETPQFDQFAQQAVRFTDAYAAPVCSPTRASLMTGKAPARLHITIWREGSANPPRNRRLLPPVAVSDLPHSESTLAERLQAAGYLTALVGKWHLGDAAHYPETQGFDVNIGGTLWGAPNSFFYPYTGGDRFKEFRYVPHLEFGKKGEYLTDRLTDEALKVIDHAGDRPFFLYLAHHAVHTPIEAKSPDIEHFQQKFAKNGTSRNATYAAMVSNLDENFGRLLAHIERRGLAGRTIVIFMSDNGGYLGNDQQQVTDNSPLRSGKGSLYEGGVRVPLLIHWPEVSRPGTTCAEPVISQDLFYTVLTMAGIAPPQETAADGNDLSPLLRDPATHLDRDALYFHYPHYYNTTSPVSAVRAGDWKLLHYYEDDHIELYNLRDDLSEKVDLGEKTIDKVVELRQRLDDWLETVDAQKPAENPEFTDLPRKT